MTTTILRRAALAALLALAASPAPAQPIEADSHDALVEPGARQYDARRDDARRYDAPRPPPRGGQFRDPSRFGAASPDLPATVAQQPGGYGVPYGGYGYPGGPPGYVGRDGYGSADGYGAGYPVGGYDDGPYGQPGSLGGSGRAFVAPFGGGPGNQTPIPLGAGSLYSGSAVNGTAAGPQFSSQLPAYQDRQRR